MPLEGLLMSSMIGQKAPDFSLQTSDGEEFNFSDLDGSWKVVFFYAKAGSPTCKRGCLNVSSNNMISSAHWSHL